MEPAPREANNINLPGVLEEADQEVFVMTNNTNEGIKQFFYGC
jgi:hypothetical protein